MNCLSSLSRGYWLSVQGLYQSDPAFSFEITDSIHFDIIYECVMFLKSSWNRHFFKKDLEQEIIFWWKKIKLLHKNKFEFIFLVLLKINRSDIDKNLCGDYH